MEQTYISDKELSAGVFECCWGTICRRRGRHPDDGLDVIVGGDAWWWLGGTGK